LATALKKASLARDSKRRSLQGCLGKRKICTGALHWKRSKGWLTYGEKINLKVSKENCYTHVCDLELAWRSNEAANCKLPSSLGTKLITIDNEEEEWNTILLLGKHRARWFQVAS
jgi:hypothetical protein